MKPVLFVIGFLLLASAAIETAVVESEGDYKHEVLGGAGPARGLVGGGLAVERATLTGATPDALGIIGGAGSTGHSQRLLDEALRKSAARVISTRSFWIFQPNEETDSGEPNRQVAMRLAEKLGRDTAQQLN